MIETRGGTMAHPRSRGENVYNEIRSVLGEGSSPLTRGKHTEALHALTQGRLIPAHAGKTVSEVDTTASLAAHPRSRGENERMDREGLASWGSSPLTRGKHR